MPIELNENCEQRLTAVIRETLAGLVVSRGNWLQLSGLEKLVEANSILPNNTEKSVTRVLVDTLGEWPIWEFVFDRLWRELQQARKFDHEAGNIRLQEIDGYTDGNKVAERLVAEFKTLPWDCAAILRLPIPADCGVRFNENGRRELGCGISFLKGSPEVEQQYQLIHPPSRRGVPDSLGNILGIKDAWSVDSVYIEVRFRGYSAKHTETYSLREAVATIEAVLGLLRAYNIVDLRGSMPSSINEPPLWIFQKENDMWKQEEPKLLQAEMATVLEKLRLQDNPSELTDEQGKLFVHRLIEMLEKACQCLEVERLRRASQWYFQSFYTQNELLAFIQATVAVEILLGEGSKGSDIGLMELLGNRCAYLIGKSDADRTDILTQFRKAYGTRSEIVHRGKARLDSEEQVSLRTLQWICARSIQEEVKVLSAGRAAGRSE
jgi:hypothetical protein